MREKIPKEKEKLLQRVTIAKPKATSNVKKKSFRHKKYAPVPLRGVAQETESKLGLLGKSL